MSYSDLFQASSLPIRRHVKVQAAHQPVLTTQLYFPGEPRNHEDDLYRSDLAMTVKPGAETRQGRFHFVLEA